MFFIIVYQIFWYVKYATKIVGIMKAVIEIQFEKNLKALRLGKNLTQKQLGALLNVDQRTISAWEKGICEPSFQLLASLCELFDETFDSILR